MKSKLNRENTFRSSPSAVVRAGNTLLTYLGEYVTNMTSIVDMCREYVVSVLVGTFGGQFMVHVVVT